MVNYSNNKKNVSETIFIQGGYYEGQMEIKRKGEDPLYIKRHHFRVSALAIDEKEEKLITGCERGSIFVWNINKKESRLKDQVRL